jgi:hypothetical protein
MTPVIARRRVLQGARMHESTVAGSVGDKSNSVVELGRLSDQPLEERQVA